MADVLIAAMLSIKFSNVVCIDNFVFKLHHPATTLLALGLSAVVTIRQYVGDPIDCIMDSSGTDRELMDTFPDKQDGSGAINIPAPLTADHREKHYSYHIWVCLVLIFQALLLYIPSYLWKLWEGKRMETLITVLNDPSTSDAVKRQRQTFILEYLISNMNNHNLYAFKFFFCECLNFVNAISQISVMIILFDYAIISPCVLPADNFYANIYTMHRRWLSFLAVVSGFALLYRLAIIFVSQVRMCCLIDESSFDRVRDIKKICRQCQVGDWFVLNLLRKNVKGAVFRDLLRGVASTLEDGHTD